MPSAHFPRRPPRSAAVSDPAQFALPFLIEPQRRAALKAPKQVHESELPPAISAESLGKPRPAEQSTNIQDSNRRRRKQTVGEKKPATETVPVDGKVLVSRKVAAHMLSISVRAVDYLIATKKLGTRRIGTRVMIPVEEIRRFARSDHPDRMAG